MTMKLRLGNATLDLSSPLVMGVLNVTPDSFSDGGRFLDLDGALRQAERMIVEGAAIIDVGGESTRPGAAAVPEQAEIDRVVPVVEAITSRFDVPVSVDTAKSPVMAAALRGGAAMINDVYALRQPGALATVAEHGATVCLMHMQGEPRSMQQDPQYDDVVSEVSEFLAERIECCREAGIDTDRIVVDPGFGFGKTVAHNLELLAELARLSELGPPVLVGLSRKSTLGKLTGRAVDQRLAAGLAAAVLAVERGAHIVRTHDVAETVDALTIASAVRESRLGPASSGRTSSRRQGTGGGYE